MFEDDLLIAQCDWLEARIDQHLDFGWHSVGKTKCVCCGHAINQPTDLITARDRIDDGAIVRYGRFACERILGWLVVEPAFNAPQLARRDHALESLVNSSSTPDVGKIGRRPHLARRIIYARTEAIWQRFGLHGI
jgi:hypothetical protein